MDAIELAGRFLRLRRIAVVGVSRDPRAFSRRVFEAFLGAGYDAVPVNPAECEIGGRRAFARVSDVRPPVEGAFLVVAPERADAVTADALAAGVEQLWFHRGAGPGVGSAAALARCAAAGVAPVTDLCPFMMLPGAGWFHRMHAHFRKRTVARALPSAAP
jgi:predicted CoA-binding protein